MKVPNPWPLLRGSKAEQQEGLWLVQQAYNREPDASHIMQLGVVYLWLSEYGQAWEHFRKAIREFPIKGDAFYGMAGVASWCLGDSRRAVDEWRAGLKAKYARASGLNVIMPLLLFFASVARPELFPKSSAEKLLLETIKDLRIRNWPGPIARLLLDRISENEFQAHCKGMDEQDTRNRHWVAEFYRSLMRLEQGALTDFKESMHRLTDVSQPEWQDEAVFLSRLWSEEFFLARHEASSDRSNSTTCAT